MSTFPKRDLPSRTVSNWPKDRHRRLGPPIESRAYSQTKEYTAIEVGEPEGLSECASASSPWQKWGKFGDGKTASIKSMT